MKLKNSPEFYSVLGSYKVLIHTKRPALCKVGYHIPRPKNKGINKTEWFWKRMTTN